MFFNRIDVSNIDSISFLTNLVLNCIVIYENIIFALVATEQLHRIKHRAQKSGFNGLHVVSFEHGKKVISYSNREKSGHNY